MGNPSMAEVHGMFDMRKREADNSGASAAGILRLTIESL
jgi:hypothetical protein